MKLSEELVWRGFHAETTIKDLSTLDGAARKFYWGADPSADSMTIGNHAAMMMVKCFIRHGYKPYILIGGATGQIGDPKDNEERNLKPLEEVENNKNRLIKQFRRIIGEDITVVDNYDWFKDIGFLPFLREVGKQFSMTQLLDREFVKNRIGEGGVGISYAEFSYSLIQGYDFLHLYREYGVDMQVCGADQFGNCVSGLHLISRLEGEKADVYSTPLIIDPVSGRKFGKSEGNAVWLESDRTSVFDFYQFWLNQSDEAVEYLIKIYTLLGKEEVEDVLAKHFENPAARLAQKTLAFEATKVVHGAENAESAVKITEALFGGGGVEGLSENDWRLLAEFMPTVASGTGLVDALVETELASSKGEARKLLSGNAVSVNGAKVSEDVALEAPAIIKKGKNKFILVQ
jgi:tyrosyl-tRNA synthetase